jgi:hypothetical protein
METLLETKYCALIITKDGKYFVISTIDGMFRQVEVDEDYAYDLMDITENQDYWLDTYVLSELQAAKKQQNWSYYEREI